LRSLEYAGSESDKIENFQKLKAAAVKNPDLEYAAKRLKESVTIGNGYEAIGSALKSGDKAALSKALSTAGSGDLKLLAADLKKDGKTLGGMLDDLRSSSPEGYKQVLDGFTNQIGGKYVYANVSEDSTKVFKDALTDQLKRAPDADVRAYA